MQFGIKIQILESIAMLMSPIIMGFIKPINSKLNLSLFLV